MNLGSNWHSLLWYFHVISWSDELCLFCSFWLRFCPSLPKLKNTCWSRPSLWTTPLTLPATRVSGNFKQLFWEEITRESLITKSSLHPKCFIIFFHKLETWLLFLCQMVALIAVGGSITKIWLAKRSSWSENAKGIGLCDSSAPLCMNDLMVLLGPSSRSQSLSSCPLHEQPYGEAVSQRKGEALPEGKVRRLLLPLESHCPLTFPSNKHTLSYAHIRMHALASAHPGCFPSTSSHSWHHRYYVLSVVVRTRWVGFSAGFLARCPQLQASVSRSIWFCCLILAAIPFSLLFLIIHFIFFATSWSPFQFFALFAVNFTFWFLFREYPTM